MQGTACLRRRSPQNRRAGPQTPAAERRDGAAALPCRTAADPRSAAVLARRPGGGAGLRFQPDTARTEAQLQPEPRSREDARHCRCHRGGRGSSCRCRSRTGREPVADRPLDGGARPKAVAEDRHGLWIAKFNPAGRCREQRAGRACDADPCTHLRPDHGRRAVLSR